MPPQTRRFMRAWTAAPRKARSIGEREPSAARSSRLTSTNRCNRKNQMRRPGHPPDRKKPRTFRELHLTLIQELRGESTFTVTTEHSSQPRDRGESQPLDSDRPPAPEADGQVVGRPAAE